MLPLNPAETSKLLQEARQHQAAGRLAQARAALERALLAMPDIAVAHYNLARILLKMGEAPKALHHLDRAADLKPDEELVWTQYATTLLWMAEPDKSAAFLDKARAAGLERKFLKTLQETLRPKPGKSNTTLGGAPQAEVERGISYLRAGQHQKALEVASNLSRAYPKVAIIADMLAFAQFETGHMDEAEASFRRAIQLDPSYAETRANYGQFLMRQSRHDEAIAQLHEALRLMPKQPAALTSLGTALHRQARHGQAITYLTRALALDPSLVSARLELAESHLAEWQADAALSVLKPIRELKMPNARNRVLWAQALSELQRSQEAEAEFDAALVEAEHKTLAYIEKSVFLQGLGRFDEAEAILREAIKAAPLNGRAYRTLAVGTKIQADDALIGQMQQVYQDSKMTDEARMYLGFALAKALEDTKQYDQVFTYLRPANDKMRAMYPYDIAARNVSVRKTLALFENADFTSAGPAVINGFAPIFVTGLPRSGTTLVEQIIASHSTVTGGGELGYAFYMLEKVVRDILNRSEQTFALNADQMEKLGKATETQMRDQFPQADRITDKGVLSYEMIGPIRQILPNAKIIVVRRDPRDTALSMYKNIFAEGRHRYTNKLRDLGLYYHSFVEVIDFWREKLPGSFHEIEYEDLIADPDAEARKLIAACGLEWEDQCLAFHENKRRVQTLSVHQVRQPLYASSMQAWQRYQGDLGELFDALGPEFDPRVGE